MRDAVALSAQSWCVGADGKMHAAVRMRVRRELRLCGKPAATARFDRRVLGDQCDTDSTVGVQALDARLEVDSNEVGAGTALAYEIVNEGTATLMCGYAYRLERRDERDWTLVNRDMIFRAVGLLVDPGDTRTATGAEIPAAAQSGQYRISTMVRQTPPATSPPLNLTALFQVR